MTIEQLIYTHSDVATSQEQPPTMVLMVDGAMAEEYRKQHRNSKNTIPIANVVDSFQILKYENQGRSGRLVQPSKREVKDCFGTTDDVKVAEFMLQRGELHGKAGTMNDHGEQKLNFFAM